MSAPSSKAKVYFDGLCYLCSAEIGHYRKLKGAEHIAFIDITKPEFSASEEGVDPIQVHQSMHARDRNGKLHVGLDAFICIWSEIPSLNFLVPIARLRPVNAVLKLSYSVFAKIRPWLPRKSCEASPYCPVHVQGSGTSSRKE